MRDSHDRPCRDIGMARHRSGAGSIRDWTGAFRHDRSGHRSRRTGGPTQPGDGDDRKPRRRITAFGLGYRAGAFCAWHDAARNCLRNDLEQPAHRCVKAGAGGFDRRLRCDVRWRGHQEWLELPRDRRPRPRPRGRLGDRNDGAREAGVCLARWDVDHRGGAADPRLQPALSLARGHQRRRLARAAAVPQASGAADLAWRGGDGLRRRAVLVGPQTANRRSEAGGSDRAAACGMMSSPPPGWPVRDRLAQGVGSRMIWAARFIVVVVALLGATPLHAVQVDEILSDRRLESRAREISHELRCMVCQNQSIDDSEAPLARDLRLLVRERLKAGDSDAQVLDYMVARYGEFVLLKPRMSWRTAILWGAPFAILIPGLLAIGFSVLRRPGAASPEAAALTETERLKLKAITQSQTDGG